MTPSARYVRDLMTAVVVTLDRNDTLDTADDLMRLGRIRHIPVLDEEGELAGIVTQTDLYRGAVLRSLGYGQRAGQRLLHSLSIKDAMTPEVLTTTPGAELREAAEFMLQHKVGCLVVLEDRKIVGIITESDFVAAFVR